MSTKASSENNLNDFDHKKVYTLDFLLNVKSKDECIKPMENILPKIPNFEEGKFWDVEKYFDLNLRSKNETGSSLTKVKKKNSAMQLQKMGFYFNLELPKRPIKLSPGDKVEVTICTLPHDITSSFYVNMADMKTALQKFHSILNVHANNNALESKFISIEEVNPNEVVLALHKTLWHRVQKIPRTNRLISIDDGIEFTSKTIIPSEKSINDVQPFALKIQLAGIDENKFNKSVLTEFINRNDKFIMHIYLINNQKKYYVELLNDKNISLNKLLNAEFEKGIYNLI